MLTVREARDLRQRGWGGGTSDQAEKNVFLWKCINLGFLGCFGKWKSSDINVMKLLLKLEFKNKRVFLLFHTPPLT